MAAVQAGIGSPNALFLPRAAATPQPPARQPRPRAPEALLGARRRKATWLKSTRKRMAHSYCWKSTARSVKRPLPVRDCARTKSRSFRQCSARMSRLNAPNILWQGRRVAHTAYMGVERAGSRCNSGPYGGSPLPMHFDLTPCSPHCTMWALFTHSLRWLRCSSWRLTARARYQLDYPPAT